MNRSNVRHLLIAAALALAVLGGISHPTRAFASFSGADRQEQPAVSAAVAAPAAVPPSAADGQRRRVDPKHMPSKHMASKQMASKQRAMQAAMARRQGEEQQHKARRRAFVGGVLIGILAARRR